MALSNAERQAAFRARQKERLAAVPPVAPALPPIANIPASRRWQALTEQGRALLVQVRDEMQAYHDDRSDEWQEGERGQEFSSRIDALESILADLEGLVSG